jgi:thioredoxin reductase
VAIAAYNLTTNWLYFNPFRHPDDPGGTSLANARTVPKGGVSRGRGGAYDVIVVGGGPAGLSAALLLGRSRFRVLVVDAGRPRNRMVRAMHGFLGRDGAAPGELLRAGRREVARYGVAMLHGEVTAAKRRPGGYAVRLARSGRSSHPWLHCRRLLLATGVEDPLPPVPGLAELYGKSVFHCPFCDGWEVRDRPLAVYGRGGGAARFAIKLTRWSADVTLLTDGPSRLNAAERAALGAAGVVVRTARVAALEAARGRLVRVRFVNGSALPRYALFFGSRPRQTCKLAAELGVRFNSKGTVLTSRKQDTGVPGLYVVGDASRDVQLAVVAAAEGAKAAVAIAADLEEERRAARAR